MNQRKREINFNKQDSRTLLQVLEDQKLMEAMKQSRLALEGRASFAPLALDDADELGKGGLDEEDYKLQGNESPAGHAGAGGGGGGGVGPAGVLSGALSLSQEDIVGVLPNEISAPYEVPQFPIEQIEKKLQLQRQLNAK
uniref:Uncharacterized protein n=1 Tax=Anopheles melas TaxID=34690 RepID=A0A182UBK5_9DIPT